MYLPSFGNAANFVELSFPFSRGDYEVFGTLMLLFRAYFTTFLSSFVASVLTCENQIKCCFIAALFNCAAEN